jgi:hypothetical protein
VIGSNRASLQAVHQSTATLINCTHHINSHPRSHTRQPPPTQPVLEHVSPPEMIDGRPDNLTRTPHVVAERLTKLETAIASQQAATAAVGEKIDTLTEMIRGLVANASVSVDFCVTSCTFCIQLSTYSCRVTMVGQYDGG